MRRAFLGTSSNRSLKTEFLTIGFFLMVLSDACSPASYAKNVQKNAVYDCVRRSCAGASVTQGRDYAECEGICKERFGQ